MKSKHKVHEVLFNIAKERLVSGDLRDHSLFLLGRAIPYPLGPQPTGSLFFTAYQIPL